MMRTPYGGSQAVDQMGDKIANLVVRRLSCMEPELPQLDGSEADAADASRTTLSPQAPTRKRGSKSTAGAHRQVSAGAESTGSKESHQAPRSVGGSQQWTGENAKEPEPLRAEQKEQLSTLAEKLERGDVSGLPG